MKCLPMFSLSAAGCVWRKTDELFVYTCQDFLLNASVNGSEGKGWNHSFSFNAKIQYSILSSSQKKLRQECTLMCYYILIIFDRDYLLSASIPPLHYPHEYSHVHGNLCTLLVYFHLFPTSQFLSKEGEVLKSHKKKKKKKKEVVTFILPRKNQEESNISKGNLPDRN